MKAPILELWSGFQRNKLLQEVGSMKPEVNIILFYLSLFYYFLHLSCNLNVTNNETFTALLQMDWN